MNSERGGGALPAHRTSHAFVVDRAGRKPLFSSTNSRDGTARDNATPNTRHNGLGSQYRPTTSDSFMNRSRSDPEPFATERSSLEGLTPSSSRAPRSADRTMSQRKALSMAEAYRLAEREEQGDFGLDEQDATVDASPSPAPRPVRATLDDRAKATAAGRELARLTQGDGEQRRSGAEQLDFADGEVRLPALVPGIEDLPFPSNEARGAGPSPMRQFGISPEKSMAWELDQDFTMDDLQISDSPRLRVNHRPFANRLNFDSNSNVELNSNTRLNPPGMRNTKLDQIWAAERRTGEAQSPIQLSPRKTPRAGQDDISNSEHRLSVDRQNRKLEAIHQREMEGLSKRQLASFRLEEIREQNSNYRAKSILLTSPQLSRTAQTMEDAAEFEAQEPTPSRTRAPPVGAHREPATDIPATGSGSNDNHRLLATRETPRSVEGNRNWRMTSTNFTRRSLSRNRKEVTDSPQQLQRPANNNSNSPAPDHLASAPRRTAAATYSSEKSSNDSESNLPSTRRLQIRADRKPLGILNKDKSTVSQTEKGMAGEEKEKESVSRSSASASGSSAENKRLSVGFKDAGLLRVQSRESTNSKRSSMHSEPDPTERLEAELQLFAPADTYSEPGSTRAASPASDERAEGDKAEEATPKAKRPDPQTMPTPKVTGAFVETPATARVGRRQEREEEEEEDENGIEGNTTLKPEEPVPEPTSPDANPSPSLRRRSSSLGSRGTSSDPGTSEPAASETQSADETDHSVRLRTSKTAATRKPRSRSLPRRRVPLRNSAKPPSVKDDLLALHRLYNIEDSTLDDLDDILSGKKAAPSASSKRSKQSSQGSSEEATGLGESANKKVEKPEPKQPEPVEEVASTPPQTQRRPAETKKKIKKEVSDGGEEDLAAYERMNKSLRTVSLGIRSAKEGIERLEDQVIASTSPAKPKRTPVKIMDKIKAEPETKQLTFAYPTKPGPSSAFDYIRIPIPRLYHRDPNFRFTLLGLILFIVGTWYALETATCAQFCHPETCDPTYKPCISNYDDPTIFGSAIPIKLDQWITNGTGRKHFNAVYQELDDTFEDVKDAVLGRHITQVKQEMLRTPEKRAQLRRRLRKKGYLKTVVNPTPEEQAMWDGWHRVRMERERRKAAREMGYELEEEDDGEGAVGGDVPVQEW